MSEPGGVRGLGLAANEAFPAIAAARERTERGLAEHSAAFVDLEADADATVVLTGSWGRHEATSGSDHDFMVVFEGELRPDRRPSAERVAELLGGGGHGRERVFGEPVSLEDLLQKIGRDEDSNSNLTRRMLFVLESVPVSGADVHARARRALVGGYLDAASRDYRPPRFLLNDLIRYWRTIAVDFESKMRARSGEGWGLRNAKLRISRKVLFAAGLLPVLECHRLRTDEMLDYLDERMSVPPLDRIADAFAEHRVHDPGVRALRAYDEFLAILDDDRLRDELDAVTHDDRGESEIFMRVSDLGDELQLGFLTLLFDDPDLSRLVRDYLIF